MQPPLFLSRNLSYINHKKSRAKKSKRRSSGKFNVLNTIIEKLTERKCGTKHFMTLTFFGLHCDIIPNERHAEIQISHKETKTIVSS